MEKYLVGGAVRDQLLGIPVKERDWVVVGTTPEEMIRLGYRQVGRDFPVFLHPDTQEEFALARTERKTGRGYLGFTCHSSPDITLEQDLLRRDITINAMAQATDGEIIDPYNGQDDLQNRILRHVSEAFIEDPLRILRVARFAAKLKHLDFTVAPETLSLMQSMVKVGELDTLSPERIWQEFYKSLITPSPETFIGVLDQCGALPVLLPDLKSQGSSIDALKEASSTEQSITIRFACLMYDREESVEFNQQRIDHFAKKYHVPNDIESLAQLLVESISLIKSMDHAEGVLNFFEKTDAFRRTERFNELLIALEIVSTDSHSNTDQLHQCLSLARAVKLAPEQLEQLEGKAIGEKLRDMRLLAIRKIL